MHITLTGNLGSGKSTLSKILEAEYGYEIFSTGKVIRKIAEEHGLSVLEMNELMNKDPKYDHEIDDTTARISREAPVLILRHYNTKVILGAASNAANNIASLNGGKVSVIGVCGDDLRYPLSHFLRK